VAKGISGNYKSMGGRRSSQRWFGSRKTSPDESYDQALECLRKMLKEGRRPEMDAAKFREAVDSLRKTLKEERERKKKESRR